MAATSKSQTLASPQGSYRYVFGAAFMNLAMGIEPNYGSARAEEITTELPEKVGALLYENAVVVLTELNPKWK